MSGFDKTQNEMKEINLLNTKNIINTKTDYVEDVKKRVSLDDVNQNELNIQKEYMKEMHLRSQEFRERKGTAPKFFSLAMGCQMNTHDSEKLEGMLSEMGYEKTDKELEADFVIYNTCCVRENAEVKVYGKIGWLKHYKKDKPDLMIALCGCMTQQETVIQTLKQKHRHVDIVFGTFNLYKLPELMVTRTKSNRSVYDIWQEHQEIVEDLPSIREYKFKSSVNIMYGCDNFCTYCIVPYVRGRERSRLPEDIVKEITILAEDGVKEITLLGQNVNSYGKGLENKTSFADLIRMVNEIDGIERIRFSTSHPKDISEDVIDAMRDCDKVCKALHLPFQSGSTRVLKAMNRHYTKEDYLDLIKNAKEKIPELVFSTDIMVGFPTETEEDFQHTLDVIQEVGFVTAYTFCYSKRTGTPAATMEDQVPEEVVKDRFNRMLKIINDIIYEKNKKYVGEVVDVLVESISRTEPTTILTGRTDKNSLVHFEGDSSLIGEIVPVKVYDHTTFYLKAERI